MMGMKTKQIEVSTKPVEINIMQPNLPRAINLIEPKWYVVSEAKITNPCVKDADGKRPRNEDKSCKLGKENPDWPEGYTYLDQFLDEMERQNAGGIVFVATTIGDYEAMSANMQELRRYIRELGEVIIYYRNVTIKGEPAVGVGVKLDNEGSKRPSIGLFPRNKDESSENKE
jgi:hypothetical protein